MIDTVEALKVGDLKEIQTSSPNYLGLIGNFLDGSTTIEEKVCAEYDCTCFKSVGTAIQDLLTADEVFNRATEELAGTVVDLY